MGPGSASAPTASGSRRPPAAPACGRLGGGCFAFSPDGKLLAVDTGFGAVRLLDPDTGREYARLEDPNQDRAFWMSFSPDGSQLVASSQDGQSVHVWDLRAIRKQLADMDLDWGLPQYPPPDPGAGQPLHVQVDLGDLPAMTQAHGHHREACGHVNARQWGKAVGAYAQAIGLDPKNARALNNLAWLLATCPDAKFRDPGRALGLARRAVDSTPQEGNAWNTLGVAHYRAGDWKGAVAALEKSHDLLGGEELSFNAFFLAMAQCRLGHKNAARQWYDRAVQWMEKYKPQDEELRRFRTEAAELLDLDTKKD
jgi:tetratricopeptide (TPR) repeat protein